MEKITFKKHGFHLDTLLFNKLQGPLSPARPTRTLLSGH